MSQYIDLYANQDEDFSHSFTVTNNDGTAFDLTGYSSSCAIRRSPFSSSSMVLSSSISSPTTGGITLSVASSVLSTIFPARYEYDLVVSSSSGAKILVFKGMFILEGGIISGQDNVTFFGDSE